MVKIIGALFIIVAASLYGEYKARSYIFRFRQLQYCQLALELLVSEISFSVTPLPLAFKNIAGRVNGPISGIFRKASSLITARNDVTAGEAWRKAIDNIYPQTFLTQGDIDMLKRLSISLGISDKSGQIKQIRLVQEQLNQVLEEASDRSQKNERMWRYLGFLGGLMLVILLI